MRRTPEPTLVRKLSGVPLKERLLDSLANIRSFLKGLLETNTLAYYKHS